MTTADKNDNNLVLVGGPVANALTASLVRTNAADAGTLDSWKASEGDIKVVADAFATGKYGIIVAGNNRDATRAAAQAPADAL